MTITVTPNLPTDYLGRYTAPEGGNVQLRVEHTASLRAESVQIGPYDYQIGKTFVADVVPQTVNFGATETTTKYVDFRLLNDTFYESGEAWYFNVQGLNGSSVSQTYPNGLVTDNDQLPSLALSTTTPTVLENAANAKIQFEVTRTGADLSMITDVEVQFTGEGGTPVESSDLFGANAGLSRVLVRFNPGEGSKFIDIGVLNDATIEANEGLRATFYSTNNTSPEGRFSSPAYNGITTYSAVATILNDDPNPPAVVPTPLATGTPTVIVIPDATVKAQYLAQSNEAHTILLYDTMLGREAEPAGIKYYTDILNGGQSSLQGIVDNFYQSPEFFSKYGNTTNTTFVDLLYHNTLDRGPEPGGAEYYVSRLESGEFTRGQVVTGFSESPEHRTLVQHDYHILFT